MNLHGIIAPVIAAVNPLISATVRISTGQNSIDAAGRQVPSYATPGAFTGSIAADELTVTVATSGVLQIGQTLVGTGIADGTLLTELRSGSGGAGTYGVNQPQTVASTAIATLLRLRAQVQPMTWRDIQQLDGLNLQGTRVKIYLYGRIDGLVRPLSKGGDLVTIATGGKWDGTYLVAQVLEQFPDWVSAACTLQNGA